MKGGERERRGIPSATRYSNIQAGHKIQQWKKFLSTSDNKQQFINFIGEEWQLSQYRSKLESKEFFPTTGGTCRKLSVTTVEVIQELTCTYEEADTRLLLHASHAAANGLHNIIVAVDDTDVL